MGIPAIKYKGVKDILYEAAPTALSAGKNLAKQQLLIVMLEKMLRATATDLLGPNDQSYDLSHGRITGAVASKATDLAANKVRDLT